MGGLYFNKWSCSNCDYRESTVSGPLVVQPKEGVPKAKIEYRWCSDCNGIRRVFTAEGYEFQLGEEPGSAVTTYIYEFGNMIGLKKKIDNLEHLRKTKFLFSLTKQAKKLKELKEILPLYEQAQSKCEQVTREVKEHYQSLNLKPKCLICGGENVSLNNWDEDNHHCGGVFEHRDSGRIGVTGQVRHFTSQVQYIEYDEEGNPESTKRPGKTLLY